MKNKFKIIGIFVVFAILLFVGSLFILKGINRSDEIPEGFIAVFHGGTGEQTYETYIYKVDNGQANYGFKYINVTSTTEFYGSSNLIHKITDKGEFDWTDGAFSVARKNGAYSYVTLPNNSKMYTIEEFQSMFLMN